MRFEIFQGDDGQHYWRLVAQNGETLAVSEGYGKLDDCADTVRSIKGHGVDMSTDVRLV